MIFGSSPHRPFGPRAKTSGNCFFAVVSFSSVNFVYRVYHFYRYRHNTMQAVALQVLFENSAILCWYGKPVSAIPQKHSTFQLTQRLASATFSPVTRRQALQAMGRLGGKAGKGDAKRRTEQSRAWWASPAGVARKEAMRKPVAIITPQQQAA
jgi:hypothetical protein